MAKLRNKTLQRKQSKVTEKKQKDSSVLQEDMRQRMQDKDYAAAIEIMAEMAASGYMDADTMYLGAKCYFMLGDYDRAAKWMDNVLSRQADSLSARILLSALCIAQKRYEDGLKICEFILSDREKVLSAEDEELLENGLKYVAAMQKALFNDYPACRNYLGITDEAANALAKLHKLMDDAKQGEGFVQARSAEDGVEKTGDVEVAAETGVKCKEEQFVKVDTGAAFDTNRIVTDVMSKAVSLRDKVKLFNAFAGGCYQAGDYQSAFELLSAALQLDDKDDLILKNMAYTCMAAGEKEQALEYAAKMTMVDFALLHAVKNS